MAKDFLLIVIVLIESIDVMIILNCYPAVEKDVLKMTVSDLQYGFQN